MDSDLPTTKKSLGQHWLYDNEVLETIADYADIQADDTLLEVGPGLGTLSAVLVRKAKKVIAVEFDAELSEPLIKKITAANFELVHQDIRRFNFSSLPSGYKIVANIPYYLTSHLIRIISETPNPASIAVLLVQKEVAERIAAQPGNLSILGLTAQFYWQVELGSVVPAALFTPPPKVDSQILILKRPLEPLLNGINTKLFFRIIKAGFHERRKKLRSSLADGLGRPKVELEEELKKAGIDFNLRPQELSLQDWLAIYHALAKSLI